MVKQKITERYSDNCAGEKGLTYHRHFHRFNVQLLKETFLGQKWLQSSEKQRWHIRAKTNAVIYSFAATSSLKMAICGKHCCQLFFVLRAIMEAIIYMNCLQSSWQRWQMFFFQQFHGSEIFSFRSILAFKQINKRRGRHRLVSKGFVVRASVTRLGEILPLLRNFKYIWGSFSSCQYFESTLAK